MRSCGDASTNNDNVVSADIDRGDCIAALLKYFVTTMCYMSYWCCWKSLNAVILIKGRFNSTQHLFKQSLYKMIMTISARHTVKEIVSKANKCQTLLE